MTTCPDMSALSAERDHTGQIREHLADCDTCRALATLAAANGDESVGDMGEDCLEMESLIAARASGPLDTRDEEQLLSHVDDCARCAAVAATVWLDADIGQVADPLAAPRPVAVPIDVGRAIRLGRERTGMRPIAVATALAAVALLVIGILWSRRPADPAAQRDVERIEHSAARGSDEPSLPAAGRGPRKAASKTPKKANKTPKKKPPKKAPAPREDTAKSADRVRTVRKDPLQKLSKKHIAVAKSRMAKSVARCRKQNEHDARLEVSFLVKRSGSVGWVRTNARDKVRRCIERSARRLPFPQTKTEISLTWVFEARRTEQPELDEQGQTKDEREREKEYKKLLQDARTAAKMAEFGRALRLCEKALAIKQTSEAIMVCAIAACNMTSKSKAKRYISRVRSAGRRNMVTQICLRNGLKLD